VENNDIKYDRLSSIQDTYNQEKITINNMNSADKILTNFNRTHTNFNALKKNKKFKNDDLDILNSPRLLTANKTFKSCNNSQNLKKTLEVITPCENNKSEKGISTDFKPFTFLERVSSKKKLKIDIKEEKQKLLFKNLESDVFLRENYKCIKRSDEIMEKKKEVDKKKVSSLSNRDVFFYNVFTQTLSTDNKEESLAPTLKDSIIKYKKINRKGDMKKISSLFNKDIFFYNVFKQALSTDTKKNRTKTIESLAPALKDTIINFKKINSKGGIFEKLKLHIEEKKTNYIKKTYLCSEKLETKERKEITQPFSESKGSTNIANEIQELKKIKLNTAINPNVFSKLNDPTSFKENKNDLQLHLKDQNKLINTPKNQFINEDNCVKVLPASYNNYEIKRLNYKILDIDLDIELNNENIVDSPENIEDLKHYSEKVANFDLDKIIPTGLTKQQNSEDDRSINYL